MPFNLKQANREKFPIETARGMIEVDQEQFGKLLKKKMLSDIAIQKLFQRFEISPDRLSDLIVQIVDLEGRYAETDETSMSLDVHLFEGGKFFYENYFIAVHELVHWLSRLKEQEAYFNDPEEVLGFVAAIASELNAKRDLDVIWNKIYPKVEFHFNDESDARQFFQQSIEKAYDLLQ